MYNPSTQDQAVGYDLQQRMIKANGTVKKVHTMNTLHLTFVVDPGKFLEIIREIN